MAAMAGCRVRPLDGSQLDASLGSDSSGGAGGNNTGGNGGDASADANLDAAAGGPGQDPAEGSADSSSSSSDSGSDDGGIDSGSADGGIDSGSADGGIDADVDSGLEPGSDCRTTNQCSAGHYCKYDNVECSDDGTCQFIPESCAGDWAPACGCDDQDYSNACAAESNSANVRAPREAVTESDSCCFYDENCDFGEQCLGASCSLEGEGQCKPTTVSSGKCWDNSYCDVSETCVDVRICPCNAVCIVEDQEGDCTVL